MIYELNSSELAKILNDYGKVKVLEQVKGVYKSRCDENKLSGLCSALVYVLSLLNALHKHAEFHGVGFVDECGHEIPNWVAYKSIFPQWTRLEAYKLVYAPKTIRDVDGDVAAWYLSGYWWPCDDHDARFEYLDKMIDIYKRPPAG